MPRGIYDRKTAAKRKTKRAPSADARPIMEKLNDAVEELTSHRTHDAKPPNVIGVVEAATCAFNAVSERHLDVEDAQLFVRLLMAMKP